MQASFGPPCSPTLLNIVQEVGEVVVLEGFASQDRWGPGHGKRRSTESGGTGPGNEEGPTRTWSRASQTRSSQKLNAPRRPHSFRRTAGCTWVRTCCVLSPPPLTLTSDLLENLGGAVPPSPPWSDRGRGQPKGSAGAGAEQAGASVSAFGETGAGSGRLDAGGSAHMARAGDGSESLVRLTSIPHLQHWRSESLSACPADQGDREPFNPRVPRDP